MKKDLKQKAFHKYSQAEIKYIRKNYTSKTDRQISVALKRTVSGIRCKRQSLGLVSNKLRLNYFPNNADFYERRKVATATIRADKGRKKIKLMHSLAEEYEIETSLLKKAEIRIKLLKLSRLLDCNNELVTKHK